MKNVIITIPDNSELVKEGNTYVIKEKDSKPKSWGEFCMNYRIQPQECFINNGSEIIQLAESSSIRAYEQDKNLCVSQKEAEAFLALMQLRQLRKAWVDNWEPKGDNPMAVIQQDRGSGNIKIVVGESTTNRVMSFPTIGMAYEFLDCFKDLCEIAKILL